MARRLIRRWFRNLDRIREHKQLRFFGALLHDPNLWHLNRHSVAVAFAIGLFWAFIPIPFQMFPAAAFAIYFRANLPISVVLVWITNPVTMAASYYFCYTVGRLILQTPPQAFVFEPSWEWFTSELARIWQPFLLGSLVVASASSLLGYAGMRLLWRWHVVREWERRKGRPKRGAAKRT